ncbi:hypothetical protein AS006_01650 [Thermotoga sp. SG1]|nr:hypothetical protein [Thermotoga sp. SG1]PLV57601.1 hypothetical protein AS006_01650 [Thermotoga sp. SG1]
MEDEKLKGQIRRVCERSEKAFYENVRGRFSGRSTLPSTCLLRKESTILERVSLACRWIPSSCLGRKKKHPARGALQTVYSSINSV